MKRITFTKRILAVALCIIMMLSIVPMTANAATTTVRGAEGHILEEVETFVFTDGYNSPIFIYATPGAYKLPYTTYTLRDFGGNFGVPEYDSEQWYFAGWKTWYKGSHSGAGLITSDKANPKYDDNNYYFTSHGYDMVGYPLGYMSVLKETLWDGTYYLSAIYEPIVTVNAGTGVSYTVSGASKRANNKYSTQYNSGMTIDYSADDGYIVTGVSANYGTSYSDDGDAVSLTNVTRPATVNINARLKQQKVNFNANGGSGTMAEQTFEYGVEKSLSANTFTRTGYTFAGWNTKVDGTGAAYTDKQSVTFTPVNDGDSITLYAQWKEIPDSQVSTAPTAKNLIYDGNAQELITTGKADNGEMQYVIGTDNTTAPTSGWSTTVPTGINAGTYYVWYKVVGNTGYNDVAPACIAVTVAPRTVTVSLGGSVTKTYDGQTTVPAENNLELNLTDAIQGNDVSVMATFAYGKSAVGIGIAVTATNIQLTGTAAGNYTLSSTTASANVGSITKATPELGTVTAEELVDTTDISKVVLSRTGTTVPGTLRVDPGQTLKLGQNTVLYTFTPDDKANYNKVTGTVTVIVTESVCDGVHNCPSRKFPDLDTQKWYHEATDFVIENGYMQGFTDGTFGPDKPLTRAQIVQILYNMEGRPTVSGLDAFTDTRSGSWYTDAILWASQNKIVLGYGNGKFGPYDVLTREQMVTILYRYSDMKDYALTEGDYSRFPDAAAVSQYARTPMKWAVGKGLIVGMENGTLCPKCDTNRAQAATLFMRFIELLAS